MTLWVIKIDNDDETTGPKLCENSISKLLNFISRAYHEKHDVFGLVVIEQFIISKLLGWVGCESVLIVAGTFFEGQ